MLKTHLSGFCFCSEELLKSEIEGSLNCSSEERARRVCVCVFYLMSICQGRPDNTKGGFKGRVCRRSEAAARSTSGLKNNCHTLQHFHRRCQEQSRPVQRRTNPCGTRGGEERDGHVEKLKSSRVRLHLQPSKFGRDTGFIAPCGGDLAETLPVPAFS